MKNSRFFFAFSLQMDTCVCRYLGFFPPQVQDFQTSLGTRWFVRISLKKYFCWQPLFFSEFTLAFIGKMACISARIWDSKIGHGLAIYKYHNLKSKLLGKCRCKTSLCWLINSHFVLILPCICLLLPGKCNLLVWGLVVLHCVSYGFCFLKLYLCSAVSGWHHWCVLLDSCLDPDKNQFKQWSLTISFQSM